MQWCRRQCVALEIVVQMAVQMMLEDGNGEGVGGVIVSDRVVGDREFSGGGSLLVQMKLLIRYAFKTHVRHLALPVQYLPQRRLHPLQKKTHLIIKILKSFHMLHNFQIEQCLIRI